MIDAGRLPHEAIMVAQELVIEKDRHRTLRHRADIHALLALSIKTALKEHREEKERKRVEAEALVASGVQDEVVLTQDPSGAIVAVTRQDEEGRITKVIGTADTGSSLDEMARVLAERVASQVFDQIKARLSVMAAGFVRQEIKPVVESYRPRVLVVGPIAEQQARLRAEFGQLLDLRFVASGESPKRVGDIAPGCDKIVLWTKYINHQHQEHAPREKRVLVGGGFEAVQDALLAIAV